METVLWIFLAVQAFICAGLSWNQAKHKGYDEGAWTAAGFFLGIFSLIAIVGLPDKKPMAPPNYLSKKCPDCAETIRQEAIVCKFCRKQFPKEVVLQDLLKILNNGSTENRLMAINALRSANNSSVAFELVKVIDKNNYMQWDNGNDWVRKCTKLLSEIGDPTIAPYLISIVKRTSDENKASDLIKLIGLFREPSSLPFLFEIFLNNKLSNTITNKAAINAIESYGDSALPYLEKIVQKGEKRDRSTAGKMIARLRSKSNN